MIHKNNLSSVFSSFFLMHSHDHQTFQQKYDNYMNAQQVRIIRIKAKFLYEIK